MDWKSKVIDKENKIFTIDSGEYMGSSTKTTLQYIGKIKNNDHLLKIIDHSEDAVNRDDYLRQGLKDGSVNRFIDVDKLWFSVRGICLKELEQ